MSQFSQIPVDLPDHNVFSLGNRLTTTLDFGRLQVAKVFEAVPSDVVNINLHAFVQSAPNPVPINGKMTMSAHAFFVPTRVVCSGWNNYILGLQELQIPYITFAQIRSNLSAIKTSLGSNAYSDACARLADMGYPAALFDSAPDTNLNNMRFNANILRCIKRIWFDWYRDKNSISDANVSSYCLSTMGNLTDAEIKILLLADYRCYPKDYVTSMFPAPSEGGIQSCVPTLTANNPASQNRAFNSHNVMNSTPKGINQHDVLYGSFVNDVLQGAATLTTSAQMYDQGLNTDTTVQNQGGSNGSYVMHFNIQQLRGANSYQRWLEHLVCCGKSVLTRLKGLFNASDTPERLQMSEYIGGTETEFSFNQHTSSVSSDISDEAEQTPTAFGYTNSYGSTTMAGQKSGDSSCTLSLDGVSYHAKEHGYVIIITSIMPAPINYLGLDRTLVRGVQTLGNDRFDFFTHEFENLGFQPVLMQDVVVPSYMDTSVPTGGYPTYDPLKVVGYQQRYMDYKYSQDILGGQFNLPASRLTLKNFHFGRDLLQELGLVYLNGKAWKTSTTKYEDVVKPSTLVTCDYNSRSMWDGKFTISDDELDHFIVNYKIDVTASRPMVLNSIPALSEAEAQGGHGKQMVPTGGVRL